MLARIVRHEWKIMRADRSAVVVVILFTALTLVAAVTGVRRARATQASVAAVVEAQELRYREGRQTLVKGVAAEESGWGPASPNWLGGFVGSYAVQPPAPLLSLATGQGDLTAPYAKVTARGREALAPEPQIGNPLFLQTGQFDLAFVLVYLYPLFVLALAYDLTSSERDDGTLRVLASQPVSLRRVVLGKLLARGLVILVPAVLAPLAVLPWDGLPLDGGGWLRLLVWTTAVAAYGLVWFALAVLVNARGRTPAFNALALSGAWLALVVIVPAAINLVVGTWYPVPSRVEFVNAARTATNTARIESTRVLGRFIEEHPEFAVEGDAMKNASVLTAARDEELSRQMEPVTTRFEAQRARQHAVVGWLRFLSPAALLHSVLVDAAGTGVGRQLHFASQVDAFHQAWRRHFQPLLFGNVTLTPTAYDRLPTFTYREEPAAPVALRLLAAVAVMALAAAGALVLGLRAYDRYAIAE